MGQFDRVKEFSERQVKDKKKRIIGGQEGNLKRNRWSRWIAEMTFYPQTANKQNQFGRIGYIVVKFRPYFSEKNGVLYTYSPAIMLNKSEKFFWDMLDASSIGSAYYEEKKKRDNALINKLGVKPKNAKPINNKTGNQLLGYNKYDRNGTKTKHHFLQSNQIRYTSNKGNLRKKLK